MLDLSLQIKKYEIKWFDGQVLHLDLPSQALLMKVMKIEDIEDEKEQFTVLIEILGDILNSNSEGREFSKEEIQAIPLGTIELILTDYVSSINERLGE